MTTITCEELDTALAKAKLGVGAGELHGSVTGYLCAGLAGPAQELLAALQLESDDTGLVDPLHALIDRLVAEISSELRSGETVTPLLPDAPLSARADGLVEWCRGFLGGLGLTGVVADAGLKSETHELLDEFGRIAATRLECDEDDHEVFAEVMGFVRGGVSHLHLALAPADCR